MKDVDKQNLLRGSLLVSLLAAAGICAGVAYTLLRNSEDATAVETFNSIAEGASFAARQMAQQNVYGSAVMAEILSQRFPDASDWPFVEYPGYVNVSNAIAALSGSLSQVGIMKIAPDQIDEFNAHVKGAYERAGRPESAGVNDWGFGVWKPDQINDPKLYEDGRIPDTDGANYWEGQDPNLAVIFLHNYDVSRSMMYNLYSQQNRGPYIDSMRECSERRAANESENRMTDCYAITDMLQLFVRPGEPAALLFTPIWPANDPGNYVGLSAVTFDWASILTKTVPSYVDGITCVIKSDSKVATYEIRSGVPTFLGEEDLHDTDFDGYRHGPVTLLDPTSATSSVNYTLTVYPNQVVFSEFQSGTPAAVAVCFVAVICFITGLFILYDIIMRRQARELQAQADGYKKEFASRLKQDLIEEDTETVNGKKKLTPAALEKVFKRLDKDGDGTVDRDELKEFMGNTVTEKDFDAMWLAIDLDKNNSLDFVEFCHFMAEVSQVDEESK